MISMVHSTSIPVAAYETLRARGVAFKQPVEVMPWGTEATCFAGPDGNEYFLVEG